jgi:heptosyltransferase-2
MAKVLIIKLGYSETLDPEIGTVSSLGDVLRTTVILHCFNGDHITWLSDESAYPLLKDNEKINRILFYNLSTVLQLQSERFDVMVNLEKVPGICALANSADAWCRYGFRFDPNTGEARAYENSHKAFQTYMDVDSKKNACRSWQEVLFEMLGKEWKGEEYLLGYKPNSSVSFKVGLNYQLGRKWPNKIWAKKNWDELYDKLVKRGYSVSWQQGLKNIEDYINWLNGCEIIVTHDSLGLHLGLALKKKVIALFGPTISDEVYLYDRGIAINPLGKYDCLPCLKQVCNLENSCMESITTENVFSEIEKMINNGNGNTS